MIGQGKKCLQWRHHHAMNSGVVCDHSGPLYTQGIVKGYRARRHRRRMHSLSSGHVSPLPRLPRQWE